MSLFEVLEESGEYHGLDISQKRVDLGNLLYSKYTSNFSFHFLDVYNSYYNPEGKIKDNEFVLPFKNRYFDLIFSCSLVNHLLPEALERNFSESSRTLNENGYILFSLFILDYYKGPDTSLNKYYEPNEIDSSGNFAFRDKFKAEELIAYKLDYIQKIAEKNNLKIERIIEGYWSHEKPNSPHELDLIILKLKE
jgi:SAM-dependent methyltransferase